MKVNIVELVIHIRTRYSCSFNIVYAFDLHVQGGGVGVGRGKYGLNEE